jgi:alkylation response protein AidB-like acyl-CoA dehydrogenase
VIGSASREELVHRAHELRPLLLEEQAATEARTHFAPETHERFREAGFYRLLVPRRYGGLEVDLPTFYAVMIAVARGCPSTGWQLCLSAGHALQLGSYFSEEAQDELFGAVDGEFIAPLSFAPEGVEVRRVPGGRIVSGTWHFASGIPYSTHHMGLIHEPEGTVAFVTPHFRRLDDWGDLIGLKGSGSHSVVVEEAFVPDHHVVPFGFFQDLQGGTPGSALHGNAMYAGQFMAFAMGELNSVQVGTAQAMLDEAERILASRSTNPSGSREDGGGVRRAEHPDPQRPSEPRCLLAAPTSRRPCLPSDLAGASVRLSGQLMTPPEAHLGGRRRALPHREHERRPRRQPHAALLARPLRVPHERPAPARLPRAGDRPRAVRAGRGLRALVDGSDVAQAEQHLAAPLVGDVGDHAVL